MTTNFYRRADGILIVYDTTNIKSFESVENWMKSIDEKANENIQKILIGNKIDLDTKRVVTKLQGKKLSKKYKIKFFEMSVFSNEGL